jgi:glycosyltransferase involved in cell wall biosynthesis
MTPVAGAGEPLGVCMFSNLFPPVVSGSSTQCWHLSRHLAGRGCRVAVVTANVTGGLPAFETVEGVRIHRLPAVRLPKLPIALNFPWLNSTLTPANARRIRGILAEERPDVLHLHNHMFDLGFAAVRGRRSLGVPLVVTMHTVIKHPNRLYDGVLRPLDRVLLKRTVLDRCDGVLCPDQNVVGYVTEAFRRTDGVLVPYGVDFHEPDPAIVSRLRERHQLAGRRAIVSLGHVHVIRNRRDLIAAMPLVRRAVPEAVLVIVGAEQSDEPRRQAQELGLGEAVVFTGAVPHAEAVAFLALAELEAHWLNQESADTTSLGVATLEAMAAGRAAVTSANLETYGPGILRDGENVVQAPREDPDRLAAILIALLTDQERRRSIGAQARATIEARFSWPAVGDQTLAIYERLVARAPSAHAQPDRS